MVIEQDIQEIFFADEKKKDLKTVQETGETQQEVGFYMGLNDFQTKKEQEQFPPDKYPIHISIDYKGGFFYESLRNTLRQLPKEKVKYRHENYYGTRFDIFLATTEGVRHVLNDKALKDAAMYVRKALTVDERIYPYQILDEARKILSPSKAIT
ncbi:MAG: hypothetical protein JNL70_11720 [Saprospiraceae bacterium]|nr:hypothetical protein [Saprospiraceae bacterium]